MKVRFDVIITETKRDDGSLIFVAALINTHSFYAPAGTGNTRKAALERLKGNIEGSLEATRIKSVEKTELVFDVDD